MTECVIKWTGIIIHLLYVIVLTKSLPFRNDVVRVISKPGLKHTCMADNLHRVQTLSGPGLELHKLSTICLSKSVASRKLSEIHVDVH